MPHGKIAACLLTVTLLGGCGNLPVPDYFYDGHEDGAEVTPKQLKDTRIQVNDLITHIECELLHAGNLKTLLTDPATPDATVGSALYVAQITLTLKVEDNGGVTPSLSFIAPATSYLFGINGNFNVDRQRTYTTSYWISLNKLYFDPQVAARCRKPPSTTDKVPNLRGDLGLDGIMAAGLATRDGETTGHHYDIYVAPPTGGGGGAKPAAPAVTVSVVVDSRHPLTEKPNVRVTPDVPPPPAADPPSLAYPTFGSTVQFTVLTTADAGPTWTLTGFKGPSGSKGILNGGWTGTDTLIVAIAPAKPPADIQAVVVAFENARTAVSSFVADHQGQFVLSTADETKRDNLYKELNLAKNRYDNAASDTAGATAATQAFTNNIILQNLSGTLLH